MNPELCEQLVKLDFANRGQGMCGTVLTSIGVHDDAEAKLLMPRCMALAPERKACAYQSRPDNFARRRCECQLRVALDLPLDGQCERALNQ
jgi:hypothetical protein